MLLHTSAPGTIANYLVVLIVHGFRMLDMQGS